MKCKNCGGELSFQNGNLICKSCGAAFTTDSIYEKIDVYICYEECDAAGRRTRDSIIAQEVYRKLEDNKISTFYERVSADGMSGSDLESGKLAAIHRASIIVVLGASADAFTAIEAKYSGYFSGKPVIPFCVDVNPGVIPKTLSKIQAMNYSTIGWDRDLIKGICNILGRAPAVDMLSLYDRRKRTIIVFAAIMAVIIAIASMIAWIYLKPSETVEPSDVSQSQETTEVTEKPLTQSEIYDNAQGLLNSGKYLEAAAEFSKIAEYKDSSKQIKKIYDRYDGYYQNEEGNCSLYINVIEGEMVEFSLEKTINSKVVKAEETFDLENNCASGTYIDSWYNEGSVTIYLSNEYIILKVTTDVAENELSFGEAEVQFELKNKSDRPPIKVVTKELLLSWLESPTHTDDIMAAGYGLEYVEFPGEPDFWGGDRYKIENTDITLYTMDTGLMNGYNEEPTGKNQVIVIFAPAQSLCPEKVGQRAYVYEANEVVYIPNATDFWGYFSNKFCAYTSITDEDLDSFTIKEDSFVAFTSKKVVGESNYNILRNQSFDNDLYRCLAYTQFKKDYPSVSGILRANVLKEIDNAVLLCAYVRNTGYGANSPYVEGSFYYYRLNKKTEEIKLITAHSDERWEKYPEIFGEFLPDTMTTEPDETTTIPTEQTPPTESEETTTNPTEQTLPAEPEKPVQYVLYSVRFDKEIAVYSEPTERNGISYYPSEGDEVVRYLPAGTYNIVGWRMSAWGIWGSLEDDSGWIFYSDKDIVSSDE